MEAELAYMFRHQLVRDGAYELQVPSDRALLHRQAIDCIEALFPARIDGFSIELLEHTRAAILNDGNAADPGLQAAEHRYLRMAIEHCRSTYQIQREVEFLKQASGHPLNGTARSHADISRAATLLVAAGDMHQGIELSWQSVRIAEQGGLEAERLKAMLTLSKHLRRVGRLDELPMPETEVVARLKELNTPSTWVAALSHQADMLKGESQNKEAIEVLHEALGYAEGADFVRDRAILLERLAWNLHNEGKFAEATAHARQALELEEQIGDRLRIARVLNTLGVIHVESSHIAEAEDFYLQAVEACVTAGAMNVAVQIRGNLGNLQYYFLCKLASAVEQYNECLKFLREGGDLESELSVIKNAGSAVRTLHGNDAAKPYVQRIVDLGRKLGREGSESLQLLSDADRGASERPPQETIEALSRALEAIPPSSDLVTRVNWMILVSDVLLKVGVIRGSTELLEHARAQREDDESVIFAFLRLHGALASRGCLLNTPGIEADLQEASKISATHVPHHHVVFVQSPRLALRVLDAVGPIGLKHLSGDAPDLHAIEESVAELEEAGRYNDVMLYSGPAKVINAARTVLDEVRTAIGARRPALLFGGASPGAIGPVLRAALLERLRNLHPELATDLRERNPELWHAMNDGATPGPYPWGTSWRDIPGVAEQLRRLEPAL